MKYFVYDEWQWGDAPEIRTSNDILCLFFELKHEEIDIPKRDAFIRETKLTQRHLDYICNQCGKKAIAMIPKNKNKIFKAISNYNPDNIAYFALTQQK